jgi:hypothetical protein
MTAMDRREAEERVRPFNVSGIMIKGDPDGYQRLLSVLGRTLERPCPQARVTLPEPGSLIRPYLDVYPKMLASS